LGPFGTAATNRPIVPVPFDYDDGKIGGMMTGRGNRSTRRKPAPLPLCLPQTPHSYLDANPSRRCGKPATNRLSYDTAMKTILVSIYRKARCRNQKTGTILPLFYTEFNFLLAKMTEFEIN
jgi:hypothetical protein